MKYFKTILFSAYVTVSVSQLKVPAIIPDRPEVILVQSGNFNMGSDSDKNDETPVHNVTLAVST